ncbi:MAG: methyltransferase domain-containing protein [Pseudolabrys sp.]
MDDATLKAYDAAAADFAKDWHDQPPPCRFARTGPPFFRKGTTADIGCGSGREVAWLNDNGFPAVAYDASRGLLAEARRRYPQYTFEPAALPALSPIAPASLRQRVVRDGHHAICRAKALRRRRAGLPTSSSRAARSM